MLQSTCKHCDSPLCDVALSFPSLYQGLTWIPKRQPLCSATQPSCSRRCCAEESPLLLLRPVLTTDGVEIDRGTLKQRDRTTRHSEGTVAPALREFLTFQYGLDPKVTTVSLHTSIRDIRSRHVESV